MLACSFRFQETNRVWVRAESWASPAKSVQTATLNLLHTPRHNNSVSVHKQCPPPSMVVSIYNKPDYTCPRSVGSFGSPRQEKGSSSCSSSPWIIFFSRTALNTFALHAQSAPMHQIIFHSARSDALSRGGSDTLSGLYAPEYSPWLISVVVPTTNLTVRLTDR